MSDLSLDSTGQLILGGLLGAERGFVHTVKILKEMTKKSEG